jgi:hypothetical protein
MRWVGQVARIGEMRNSFSILVQEHERKGHLKDRPKLENNNKIDHVEVG